MKQYTLFKLELLNNWIIYMIFLLELYIARIKDTQLQNIIELSRLKLLEVLILKHVILNTNTCFILHPPVSGEFLCRGIVFVLPSIFIQPFVSDKVCLQATTNKDTLLCGKLIYNCNTADTLLVLFEICTLVVYESLNSVHIFQGVSLSLLSKERYTRGDLSTNLPQFYSAGGGIVPVVEDTDRALFRLRILSFIQADSGLTNAAILFSFMEEFLRIVYSIADILEVEASAILLILSGIKLITKSSWRVLLILYEFQNILLRIELISQTPLLSKDNVSDISSITTIPTIRAVSLSSYRTVEILFILENVILLIEFLVRIATIQSLNAECDKSDEFRATLKILIRRKLIANYILLTLRDIFRGEKLSRNRVRIANKKFYRIFPTYFPQYDYWGRRMEAVVSGYKNMPSIDEIMDLMEERDGRVPAENYEMLRTILILRVSRLETLTRAILHLSDTNVFNMFAGVLTPLFNKEAEAIRNKLLVNILMMVPLQRIVPKIDTLIKLGVDISAIIPFTIYPEAHYSVEKLKVEYAEYGGVLSCSEEDFFTDDNGGSIAISGIICWSFIDRFTQELALIFIRGLDTGFLDLNSFTITAIIAAVKTEAFLYENEQKSESEYIVCDKEADITIISAIFNSIYTYETKIRGGKKTPALKTQYWSISDLLLQPYGGDSRVQEIEYNTVLFGVADTITNLLTIPDHVTSYTKDPKKSQDELYNRLKIRSVPFLLILKQTINEHAIRWALIYRRKTWEDLQTGGSTTRGLNIGLHSIDVKEHLTKFKLEEILTKTEYRIKISGRVLTYINFPIYTACFSIELPQTDIIWQIYRVILYLIDKIILGMNIGGGVIIEYFCAVLEILLLPNNWREFGTSLIFLAGESIGGLYLQNVVTIYGLYTDRSMKLVDSRISIIDTIRTLPLTGIEYAAYSAPFTPNIERAKLLLQTIQEKLRLIVVKNSSVFENLLSLCTLNKSVRPLYKNLSIAVNTNVSEVNSTEDFENSFSSLGGIGKQVEEESISDSSTISIIEMVRGHRVLYSPGFLVGLLYIHRSVEAGIFSFNVYVMLFWILVCLTDLLPPVIIQYGLDLGKFLYDYSITTTKIAEIVNLVDILLSINNKCAVLYNDTNQQDIVGSKNTDFVAALLKKYTKTPVHMLEEYRLYIGRVYKDTFERAPTTTIRKFTIFDLIEQRNIVSTAAPEYVDGYGDPSSGDTIKAGFIMAASIYTQRLRAELLMLRVREIQFRDDLYSFYGGYDTFVFEKVAHMEDPILRLKILYLTDKIASGSILMLTLKEKVKNTEDAILYIQKLLPYIKWESICDTIKNVSFRGLDNYIRLVIKQVAGSIWIPELKRFISRSLVASIAVMDLIRVVNYLVLASILDTGKYKERPLLIGIPVWNTERLVFYAGLVGWEPEIDRKDRNLSNEILSDRGILRIFETLLSGYYYTRYLPQFILLWILSILEYSLLYFFDTEYFGNIVRGRRYPNIQPLYSIVVRLSQVVGGLAIWPHEPKRVYVDRDVTVKELIGGIKLDTYYRRVVEGVYRRRFTFPISAAGTNRLADWYDRNLLYREIIRRTEILALKRAFLRAQLLPISGFFAGVLPLDSKKIAYSEDCQIADILNLYTFKSAGREYIAIGVGITWAAYISSLIKNKPFIITSQSVDLMVNTYKDLIIKTIRQNTLVDCILVDMLDKTGVRLINADPRVRIYDTAYWLILQKNLLPVYKRIWYMLKIKYKPEYPTNRYAEIIIRTDEIEKVPGYFVIDISYLSLDERAVFLLRNHIDGITAITRILYGDKQVCGRYQAVLLIIELLEYVLLLVVLDFEWETHQVYDNAKIQLIVDTIRVPTPRKILDGLQYEIPYFIVKRFFTLLSTVRMVLLNSKNYTLLGRFGRKVSAVLCIEIFNGGGAPNSIKLQPNLTPISEEFRGGLLNSTRIYNINIRDFRAFFIQIRTDRIKEIKQEEWLGIAQSSEVIYIPSFSESGEDDHMLCIILTSITSVFMGVVHKIEYPVGKINGGELGKILEVFIKKTIPQNFPYTQSIYNFIDYFYNTEYYTGEFLDGDLSLVTLVLEWVENFTVLYRLDYGSSSPVTTNKFVGGECPIKSNKLLLMFENTLALIGEGFIYIDGVFNYAEELSPLRADIKTGWINNEKELADILIKKLFMTKIVSFDEQVIGYDLILKNEATILTEIYIKDKLNERKSLLKKLQTRNVITEVEKVLLLQEKDTRLASRLIRAIGRFIQTIWTEELWLLSGRLSRIKTKWLSRTTDPDINRQKIRRYYDKISHVLFYSERTTELDNLFTGGGSFEKEVENLRSISLYYEITRDLAEKAEQSIKLETALYGRPSKFVFSYSPFEPDWTAKKKISYGKKSVIVWELLFNRYIDAIQNRLQNMVSKERLVDKNRIRRVVATSILEREFSAVKNVPAVVGKDTPISVQKLAKYVQNLMRYNEILHQKAQKNIAAYASLGGGGVPILEFIALEILRISAKYSPARTTVKKVGWFK